MAVQKVTSYLYKCDAHMCVQFKDSTGGRPQDWGLVRVFDNKHDPDCIGDQNGWNNYDLCPEHYLQFMVGILGIQAHNVPQVPDDEP